MDIEGNLAASHGTGSLMRVTRPSTTATTLRGSSTLLRKSARHCEPVIEVIAAAPAEAWDLDADSYTADTWPLARQLDEKIRAAFGHPNGVSATLATKVMLGVFGNVPAFDTYFRAGFCAATFGPKAFGRLGRFYAEHTDTIERHRIPTLDFHTGERTQRRYSRAKIIDMIFFIEGGGSGLAPLTGG